ncbi:MAG TPA: single-stranded-DNA-specific exonuclease RecJ [Candidatus Omnitrophota bacterium]|nr:single-stranded-DNA-specific exonuclease RecJ [Candidatus Omnitrophota bacterium]
MQKIWNMAPCDFKKAADLSRLLNVPSIIAQILINRGMEDAEIAKHFLNADRKNLFDPFLLKDMDKAVYRIQEAQKNKEKILIYGDYDVDGVTSAAVLIKTLRALGLDVINYIPHRVEEGYGLNLEIASFAKSQGIHLLITVDCGITANKEIDALNAQGIDVVVIDHHEPSEILPKAYAIINSKRKDCDYPCKDLAAVGTVAKMVQALTGEIPQDVMNFVAMGTIADVVSLTSENRIFVKEGLKGIAQTQNLGLKALLQIGKIQEKELSPFHIGFVLGPRINAAGRMDSAQTALDLFLTDDPHKALQLAKQLDGFNADRQKMQKDILEEALNKIEQEMNFNQEKIIVIAQESWHRGVLGIVASKIVEKYYRPAIVISLEDNIGTGSARSIDGFHLFDALAACSSFLEEYGGHKGAAGLTIKKDNIEPFKKKINQMAEDFLEIKKLLPTVFIDAEISLRDIDIHLARLIKSLEPYGEGNPSPVFCSRNLSVISEPQILGKETLKFWVTDGRQTLSAVGFGMAKYKEMLTPENYIDLAYEIIIDDWNKTPTPQLKLKDIKLSEVEEAF